MKINRTWHHKPNKLCWQFQSVIKRFDNFIVIELLILTVPSHDRGGAGEKEMTQRSRKKKTKI